MSETQAPVRLCCGERHWTVECPDGKVMCELCFQRFELAELYVDSNGTIWDVCRTCSAPERA